VTSSSFSFFSVPSGAPGSVAFTTRSTNKLTVSWSAPSGNLRNGKLTGYRVCYSDKENSSNPSCFKKNALSNTTVIQKLRPATKYFVTVEAATNAGYGPKSMEISKMTNGGKHRSH
jgi:netrin-G3 ligand